MHQPECVYNAVEKDRWVNQGLTHIVWHLPQKHDLDLCSNVLFPWPCVCHMQQPESMDDTDVDEDWEAVQVWPTYCHPDLQPWPDLCLNFDLKWQIYLLLKLCPGNDCQIKCTFSIMVLVKVGIHVEMPKAAPKKSICHLKKLEMILKWNKNTVRLPQRYQFVLIKHKINC